MSFYAQTQTDRPLSAGNFGPSSRRCFLKAGILGTGFSLAQFHRLLAASPVQKDDGRSAILVFLKGGPSHQDTFDMKPNAPAEYRGAFRPIATNVPGIQVCEHLPQLAKRADKYAIVRGITHNLADHGLGTRYLMTGNRPTPVVNYPHMGSVASRELAADDDMPTFVAVDRPVVGPGYLGAEYGAFATGEKPRYGFPFSVRGVTLEDGISLDRFRSDQELLRDLDIAFRGFEQLDEQVRSLDRFSEQAWNLISSPRTRAAFDLSQESSEEVSRFGRHEFGQSLMLASRLVEAGVRFVTVIIEDWDTHQNNFDSLAGQLLPPLDQGLSALFDRLHARDQLSNTSVLVTGEFGRTPKVNGRAGRDHWARAMFSLFAGGDVQGGQVIGSTDDKAGEPASDSYSPDDVAASFFKNIGIDPRTEYDANVGRPITLVREGKPIDGLF